MATIRQKKLAIATIENMSKKNPLNKEKLVVSVGYSQKVAEKKATEILNSKGTLEELKELGFDSYNAKRVVGQILNKEYAEEKDRLKAAEIIFKVNGDFAAEKHVNLNVNTEELKQTILDGLSKFRNNGAK